MHWLLALPGCAATKKAGELSDDPAVSEARVGEMNARLQQLATLEQVAAEFEILTRQIAEAVKHVFPGVIWEEGQSVGKMSCPGKLAESDGYVMSTTMLVSSIPIPDDKWSASIEVVRDLAGEVGLSKNTVHQNVSANRDVRFSGADGAQLTLGSRKAALISMTTPCRLVGRMKTVDE